MIPYLRHYILVFISQLPVPGKPLGTERPGGTAMAIDTTNDPVNGEGKDISALAAEQPIHAEHDGFAQDNRAIWDSRDTYGPPGFRGLFTSHYVALCAAFSALGGLLFGYEYVYCSLFHN